MKLIALLRSLVGSERATMSVADDGAHASPSPTSARERQRPGSVVASSGRPAVATAGREGQQDQTRERERV